MSTPAMYSAPGAYPGLGQQFAAPASWSAPTHPGPATNLMAVLSIVAAGSGVTVLFGIGSIAAIVMGAIALGQIWKSGEDGRLLAIWAIVIGVVSILASLFATVVFFTSIAELVSTLAGP